MKPLERTRAIDLVGVLQVLWAIDISKMRRNRPNRIIDVSFSIEGDKLLCIVEEHNINRHFLLLGTTVCISFYVRLSHPIVSVINVDDGTIQR